MQKKESDHSFDNYKYSLFRGTENEAIHSSQNLQGSISVHPESEEGRLNRASVLVTINSSRTRQLHRLHHNHACDNVNIVPPPRVPLPQPPLPCVSSSSVLLDSSWTNSIKGFTSNVEPQNLIELVNKDHCGGAPMPAAMLGAYCPPLLPQGPINPPLLSRHGLIMCGALIEQPAEPLVK